MPEADYNYEDYDLPDYGMNPGAPAASKGYYASMYNELNFAGNRSSQLGSFDSPATPSTNTNTVASSGSSEGGSGSSSSSIYDWRNAPPSGAYATGSGSSMSPSAGRNMSAPFNAYNSAIQEAQSRSLADRSQAVSYAQQGATAAKSALQPWQEAINQLTGQKAISDQIKNYMLTSVFNRVDMDTASSLQRLTQMYAQTGRSMSPVVSQVLFDKATRSKADQQREIEIQTALQNRQSQERMATELGSLGKTSASIEQGLGSQLASIYANTNYRPADSSGLAAALAARA